MNLPRGPQDTRATTGKLRPTWRKLGQPETTGRSSWPVSITRSSSWLHCTAGTHQIQACKPPETLSCCQGQQETLRACLCHGQHSWARCRHTTHSPCLDQHFSSGSCGLRQSPTQILRTCSSNELLPLWGKRQEWGRHGWVGKWALISESPWQPWHLS